MIKEQLITDDYAIYNSDCMYVLPELEKNSIDFSVYSPPFAGLYNYSSSENDFSNCESKEQFLEQYEFLIKEISRVTKPGRLTAVHCQDVLTNVTKNYLWDFPHYIIELHEKYGFKFVNRITIWKEPLKVRIRTMVRSLMHKNIVEDSTESFTAQPDYVLLFKKGGENKTPVTHPNGLNEYPYFGANPIIPNVYRSLNDMKVDITASGIDIYDFDKTWTELLKKYKGWKDQRTNKASHIIWQRYASSVWDDIRNDFILGLYIIFIGGTLDEFNVIGTSILVNPISIATFESSYIMSSMTLFLLCLFSPLFSTLLIISYHLLMIAVFLLLMGSISVFTTLNDFSTSSLKDFAVVDNFFKLLITSLSLLSISSFVLWELSISVYSFLIILDVASTSLQIQFCTYLIFFS